MDTDSFSIEIILLQIAEVESTVCSCYSQQLATKNDKIKISNPESAVFKKFMLLRNQLFLDQENIVDFEVKETNADPVLTVVTQEQETFLDMMLNEIKDEECEDEFQENFINRCPIIVTPLEPFINWCSDLFAEELDYEILRETRVYLVSEDIQDLEVWMRKKYSKIFEFELDSWRTDKKKWPQRRNFKMFKEWFRYDVTTTIFDFEKTPVSKQF